METGYEMTLSERRRTVPYSERRHRLGPDEIEPVRDAALNRLHALLEDREPDELDEARALFRIWYRIHHYVTSRPVYPPHGTREEMSDYLTFGTVSSEEAS